VPKEQLSSSEVVICRSGLPHGRLEATGHIMAIRRHAPMAERVIAMKPFRHSTVGYRWLPLWVQLITGCSGSSENQPPVARAGADQSVDANTQVTIDGSKSTDPEGHSLTFAWRQLNGPSVALSDNRSAMATFVSPVDGTTLSFQLTVSDGHLESTATTHVRVQPSDASAAVTEISQGIPTQSSTTAGIPRTWLVDAPALPTLPADDSESEEFTESYEEHSVLFVPVVEQTLAPSATRTLKLPLSQASGLSAYAQWIGTTALLNATVELDGTVLARGVPYSVGSDRGGALVQVLAPSDGIATFSVTNTTRDPIQLRMSFASSVQ
jgi:hypothetical protein